MVAVPGVAVVVVVAAADRTNRPAVHLEEHPVAGYTKSAEGQAVVGHEEVGEEYSLGACTVVRLALCGVAVCSFERTLFGLVGESSAVKMFLVDTD